MSGEQKIYRIAGGNGRIRFKVVIILFLALKICTGFSQTVLFGSVTDAATGEPLAFVTVSSGAKTGTTTDLAGRFTLRIPAGSRFLAVSYVGYKALHLPLDSLRSVRQINLKLQAISAGLSEIIIRPGINPAHRIIRQATLNKKQNNPENLPAFSYTAYTKLIFDRLAAQVTPSPASGKPARPRTGAFLGLMESVTERKYLKPKSEEKIIATRVSGLQNPTFAPLATTLQPFSFYQDIITIIDTEFLNPISPGSLSQYDFTLEDTLFAQPDTVFIVSFSPQPGKNFKGLKGVLYINSRGFAVQNVIAEAADKALVQLKIQQKYILVAGQHWFPEQLSYELTMPDYPRKGNGMRLTGNSYFRNINLTPALKAKDFKLDVLSLAPDAATRDSLFWQKNRPAALTQKEQNTYRIIDRAGRKYKFDQKLRLFEKLMSGLVPVGKLDISINEVFQSNGYENGRLGLGLQTSDLLSERIQVGGYAGYGFGDKRWKYGGHTELTLNKMHEVAVRLQYAHDLQEPGRPQFPHSYNVLDFREFIAFKFDLIKKQEAEIRGRVFKYALMGIQVQRQETKPLYVYKYMPLPDADNNSQTFRFTNVGLNLRYAFREKLVQSLGKRVSLGTKFPVLYAAYSQGLRQWGGTFNFRKTELAIEKTFNLRNIGKTSLRSEAGFITGQVPYSQLFIGNGTFYDQGQAYIPQTFQAMPLYDFLSDRYVNLFFSHNFGSLLYKTKKFKPELILQQNSGFGTLAHPEQHQNINFQTMEKGYYEAGLLVQNIVRVNYFNFAYIGLGLGGFMRYGAYASNLSKDNLALKFSLTLATQ